jgi:trehalose 6-phosphate phosphatase
MVSLIDKFLQETTHQPLQLLLDYDGTLAHITQNPTDAFLTDSCLELLRQLARCRNVQLAIVSGRSVKQLCHFLSPLQQENIWLGGLHGGEVYHLKTNTYVQQLLLQLPEQQQFQQFKVALAKALQQQNLLTQGILLEDKQHTLALHYRLANLPVQHKAIVLLHQYLQTHLKPASAFKLQAGKQVIEVLPSGIDKGHCVQFLHQYWETHPTVLPSFAAPPLICYIGDDLTDEAAFQAVNQLNGLSIVVGKPLTESCAKATLPTVESVSAILEQLLAVVC